MKTYPKVVKELKFNEKGTFESLNKARCWLNENNYSDGSLCGDKPVGLLKGDFFIAKWKNLTTEEIKELDGVMISNDFREGEVFLLFFN